MPESESHSPADKPESEATQEPVRRGLWQMMQQDDQQQVAPTEHTANDETPPDESLPDESLPDESLPDESLPDDTASLEIGEGQATSSEEDDAPSRPPNSLWQLMNRTVPGSATTDTGATDSTPLAIDPESKDTPDTSVDHSAATDLNPPQTADAPQPLQGLWKTIGGAAAVHRDSTVVEPTAVDPVPSARDAVPQQEQQSAPQPRAAESAVLANDDITDFGFEQPVFRANTSIRTGRSRNAQLSLLTGVISLLTALLAGFPGVWGKIPAPLLGCGALTWGYIAWQDIHRSRGQQTGKALAIWGMLCGVLGIFSGPMIVVPWSTRMQSHFASQQRQDRLQNIGTALNDYHAAHQVFPPGGTTRATDSGSPQPMHGWMTALLPYLNQQAIYQTIDLKLPYDHPSNAAPFQQNVTVFQVPGGDTTRVGQGYAVSHWSAVGGSVLGNMGTVPIGVMSANSHVSRSDVTDGLSQTLVAGEVADRIPAWGSATNWRRIGKGLNREYNGFGSVTGNGSMFLHADGSVRHYSTNTDPEILKQLSTRNAGDSSH